LTLGVILRYEVSPSHFISKFSENSSSPHAYETAEYSKLLARRHWTIEQLGRSLLSFAGSRMMNRASSSAHRGSYWYPLKGGISVRSKQGSDFQAYCFVQNDYGGGFNEAIDMQGLNRFMCLIMSVAVTRLLEVTSQAQRCPHGMQPSKRWSGVPY